MKKKNLISTLYEDDFILAVNKPPRVVSVPAAGIPLQDTILGMVQKEFGAKSGGKSDGSDFQPFLLHRLDYATSGVILFGKYERDREKLENIFRDERTRKIYTTLLHGVPKGRVVKHRLAARHSAVMVEAETHFTVQKIFRILDVSCALVDAEILTGRKHQIRQHFAHIGCGVVMDDMYGDKNFNRKFRLTYRLGRMFLHAGRIEFFHPLLDRMMKIEAPLWPDLVVTMKRIGRRD